MKLLPARGAIAIVQLAADVAMRLLKGMHLPCTLMWLRTLLGIGHGIPLTGVVRTNRTWNL